ncbi:MAG: vWA domain-containing protein [Protaetiibacter sp.]
MALEQPIVLAVVAGIVIVAVVGVLWGLRRRGASWGAPVARAERVRALPSVRRAVGARVLGLAGVVTLALGGVAAAGVVAARPMQETIVQPESHSRDIMLCLDVSGSMTDVDAEVLQVFSRLAADFGGERVGLTIFNSSPVQVFPLTDDYAFVRDNLDRVRESFDYHEAIPEFWVGTLNAPGASLVGDGLAACALGFDHPDEDRARSIILATDNETNGTETVSLDQAAAYSGSLGVRVFAIDPTDAASSTSAALRSAAVATGGGYYGLRDATTVDEIVAEVQRQDATILRGEPRVVRIDDPGPWSIAVVVAALAFVLVAWRVRA